MNARRLAVQRLYWHHLREHMVDFFARQGVRPPPHPEPYPDHCWNWWRAAR